MTGGDRRRVLILGGGIAGVATALFLSDEPDIDVTVVEREPRHDAHSSGRSAEVLRVAIDDPVTRALGCQTSAMLDNPASLGFDASGMIDRSGLFVITSGAEPAWAPELESEGVAEPVQLSEFQSRAPHFMPEGDRAHWLREGGRIHVGRLLPALIRAATARGVRFVRTAGAATVTAVDGAVRGLLLDGRTELRGDDVIVAAGAWSGGIAAALGIDLPLRTTRRHMFWTADDPTRAASAPIVWDDAAGFYARPEQAGWGVSMCDVIDAEPDASPRYPVDAHARARVAALVARHLPRVGAPLAIERGWSGFRDLTPDDRPILGPDGRIDGLHWCTGLGGHGMTVSLSLGRATAAALLDRHDELGAQCARTRFESHVAS